MASEMISVDVTGEPEVLRLAEEVRRSRTPRVLRRDGEAIVVMMPLTPASRRGGAQTRENTAEARRATLESTAGSLEPATRTEDIEAMIREAKEERAERTVAKLRRP
jgi:hypothetical protein